MTKKQIDKKIKVKSGLECCSKGVCRVDNWCCPYFNVERLSCHYGDVQTDALILINALEGENEKLKKTILNLKKQIENLRKP